MMISAARTRRAKRCRTARHGASGFTLLEIVVVLAITAVIIGGSIGYLVFSADERLLRNTSGEIEVLAKRARAASILKQTPYALEFREGFVRLMPLAEAGHDEKTTASGRSIGGQRVVDASSGAVYEEFRVPPELELLVRRWNTRVWLSCLQNAVHVWRFDPDGLCEPLAIRLETPQSWMEDTYHPLTATIQESQMEAR